MGTMLDSKVPVAEQENGPRRDPKPMVERLPFHARMNQKGLRDPAVEARWLGRMTGKVAFLRHKTPWFEHRESSDWDLAVRDPQEAGGIAREVFGVPLLTVRRPYVEQRFYEWGELDFLPSFEWNGLVYLEGDRFWDGVVEGEDGLPRPRLAHDAFIVWMTGLLGGAVYNRRYDTFLAEAWRSEREEVRECLIWAFGREWAAELGDLLEQGHPEEAVERVADLRVALAQRSFLRAPMETFEKVVRHWTRELFLHWRPPFPWVAFLGPDGVGKSTVIEGLQKRLSSFRLKTLLVHWRPKMSGSEPAHAEPVVDPHARKLRGFLGSTLSLVLLAFRWMMGRLGRTWHQRAKQKMLISDRYYPDLLVDPRRYRYGGSRRLARLFFRFFPRPDLTLILLARPGVIRGRKQEVPAGELGRQLEAYRLLAGQLPNETAVVATEGSKEDLVGEVYQLVIDRLFPRES